MRRQHIMAILNGLDEKPRAVVFVGPFKRPEAAQNWADRFWQLYQDHWVSLASSREDFSKLAKRMYSPDNMCPQACFNELRDLAEDAEYTTMDFKAMDDQVAATEADEDALELEYAGESRRERRRR